MADALDDQERTARPRRAAGRPRKEPFEDRQERLLDEAVAAFADHGTAASVDRIASSAGINKALVYQHFPSKDALFAAAVRRERDRLVAFVARPQGGAVGPDGTPLRGRALVRAQFHGFVDFARAHPRSLALLRLPGAAAQLDGSGRDAVTGAVTDNLRRTLARAGLPDQVLPEVLAAAFVGMAAAVIRAGEGAGWDEEAVVDLLTDFTLAGIAGLDPALLERVDRAGGGGPAGADPTAT